MIFSQQVNAGMHNSVCSALERGDKTGEVLAVREHAIRTCSASGLLIPCEPPRTSLGEWAVRGTATAASLTTNPQDAPFSHSSQITLKYIRWDEKESKLHKPVLAPKRTKAFRNLSTE